MKDVLMHIFGATAAHAVAFDPTGDLGGSTGLSNADPVSITLNVISVVLGLLGLVFLVLVIVGGFMWMTSGGAEERVKKAKKLLYAAVIGLAIVLGAYGVSQYVFTTLYSATSGPTTQQTPTSDCAGKPDGTSCGEDLECYQGSCTYSVYIP